MKKKCQVQFSTYMVLNVFYEEWKSIINCVTGVAGSLGCSSCKEIKKQEQWLPKIVPKCLRKHTK